jgi:hypothetical protein
VTHVPSPPACTVAGVTADGIVANLDRLLPEQERMLAQAARNAELGLKGNSAVYRAFTDLDFFALTVDYDLRVLLRSLLAHPQSRLTAEKFLVLALEEADESVDKMINRLMGAIRRAGADDPAHDAFDFEVIGAAKVEFGNAMASMRADTAFTQTLRLIRNRRCPHRRRRCGHSERCHLGAHARERSAERGRGHAEPGCLLRDQHAFRAERSIPGATERAEVWR